MDFSNQEAYIIQNRAIVNPDGSKYRPFETMPADVTNPANSEYKAIADAYNLPRIKFRDTVDKQDGFSLKQHTLFFPMYHCGSRILNTHRNFEQQLADWGRITRVFKP